MAARGAEFQKSADQPSSPSQAEQGKLLASVSPFPTPLLDEKQARQQAANEGDRQSLLQRALRWLDQNAPKFGICKIYLFGSITRPGKFSQFSDLDLAVDSLQEGDPFGLMGYLATYLNREVDLVPLDQCHFAEKIRQQGIIWNANRSPD